MINHAASNIHLVVHHKRSSGPVEELGKEDGGEEGADDSGEQRDVHATCAVALGSTSGGRGTRAGARGRAARAAALACGGGDRSSGA